MYQQNHLPMTSQQSRRKSQVSINNIGQQQMDPFQQMHLQGMAMQMNMMNQPFVGGLSDTGAPPDSSGTML
jgi:hypothetical protein